MSPFLLTTQSIVASLNSIQPKVILILGAPSHTQLDPLIHSPLLPSSLLIIVSHAPPQLPSDTLPAVRIISLAAPLQPENAAAIPLVDALERAERVARVWRSHRLPGILYLSDIDDGALFKSKSPIPSVDPAQRPFDAIFNFLPSNVSDKSVLKQTILLTTVAHPFLCEPFPAAAASQPRNRWSIFHFASSPPQYSPPVIKQRALLVHVLPRSPHHYHSPPSSPLQKIASGPNSCKLVDSIHAFLLNFAYPSIPSPIDALTIERAAPYVLPATSLAIRIQYAPISAPASPTTPDHPTLNQNTLSISDIILLGLLDPPSSKTPIQKQKQRTDGTQPRTYLDSQNDILILGSDWSSPNTTNLTKLSLAAARPGLGLTLHRPPRHRPSLNRIPFSTENPTRSASTPNITRFSMPPVSAASAAAAATAPDLRHRTRPGSFLLTGKKPTRPMSLLAVLTQSEYERTVLGGEDEPPLTLTAPSTLGRSDGARITPPDTDESDVEDVVLLKPPEPTASSSRRGKPRGWVGEPPENATFGVLERTKKEKGSRRWSFWKRE